MFCVEYLVDLNAAHAAARVGYTKKSAVYAGYKLLKVPEVKAEIAKLMEERKVRTLVTSDYVILGLKEVAERCLQAKPKMEFDKEEKVYVQQRDENSGELLYEFDSSGANRALELLGKHLDVFKDGSQIKDLLGGITVNVIKNYDKTK